MTGDNLSLEVRLVELKKHLGRVEQGKCRECGHVYENKDQEIEKINKEIKETINALDAKKESEQAPLEKMLKEKTAKLSATQVEIEKHRYDLSVILNLDEQDKLEIEEKQTQVKTLKTKKESGKALVERGLKQELKDAESNLIKDLTYQKAILDAEKVLVDGGVRSYILKQYLPSFNATLKKYLQLMGAGFSFTFDSEFNDIVDSRYRNSFSYGSLSTGQRARVNFAIIFTFIEFIEKKNSTKADFIILDEALENGLDEEGKTQILSIIRDKINKRVMVISHDQKIQDSFEKKLFVSTRGSFTKVIQA